MTSTGQRVSVIIPTYNRAQLLRLTVDSVLRQTVRVHEIIVVDDGSTDETAEVMRSYGPAVIYLTQDHGGVAAAFNRGMARATGDWIAFLGSDDLWKPEKIERQFQHLAQHPGCGLLHTGYVEFGMRNRTLPPRPHFVSGDYRVEYFLFGEDWICASSVLVRSDLSISFHEWAEASEDIIYHGDLVRAGVQFGYINEPLVEYRVHLGSMNFEPGSQVRGASCQRRWICETYATDPLEQSRLLGILFMKGVQQMKNYKRSRCWPAYWAWRKWLTNHWPSSMPLPECLHERIYPNITYKVADMPRKFVRLLVDR